MHPSPPFPTDVSCCSRNLSDCSCNRLITLTFHSRFLVLVWLLRFYGSSVSLFPSSRGRNIKVGWILNSFPTFRATLTRCSYLKHRVRPTPDLVQKRTTSQVIDLSRYTSIRLRKLKPKFIHKSSAWKSLTSGYGCTTSLFTVLLLSSHCQPEIHLGSCQKPPQTNLCSLH